MACFWDSLQELSLPDGLSLRFWESLSAFCRRCFPFSLFFCTCSFLSCRPTFSPFFPPCTSAWPPRTSTNGFVPPLQREPGCTVSGNHLLAAIHEEEVNEESSSRSGSTGNRNARRPRGFCAGWRSR